MSNKLQWLALTKQVKHEALLHNFKPMYYIDQRETIQLWAKVIPEDWQDNRLIGSQSNTDFLAFNLTSWEIYSETQGIGVTTRDVNAVIKLPGNINRLSESPVEVSFAIKTFSEDSACNTLKAGSFKFILFNNVSFSPASFRADCNHE
ncbi:hypothetical protein P5673_033345 [Acropora cervicornis]|uniref:Uncharacterized protein n=1 Tax=Acropora cervicornis TaxID=6130 RepID=A0AAD9UR71_ACRCE|nr:hypothetical protein P5673_033345 [Acropora cervicornis]